MDEKGSVDNRVQFRAGPGTPLGREILARTGGERDSLVVTQTATRDLERYYSALRRTLPRIRFAHGEALAILDALWSTLMIDEAAPFYLDGEVADAIRLEAVDQKWDIDGAALVATLRELTPFERLAIADAIERAKLLQGVSPEDSLRQVALIRD